MNMREPQATDKTSKVRALRNILSGITISLQIERLHDALEVIFSRFAQSSQNSVRSYGVTRELLRPHLGVGED